MISLALVALGLLAWDAWRRTLAQRKHDDAHLDAAKVVRGEVQTLRDEVAALKSRLGKVETDTVGRRMNRA